MNTLILNSGYEAIFCGITAAFFAQVIKFFVFTIRTRKINFKIFTTTGGMPSSHSAGVMGLTTAVGIIAGFDICRCSRLCIDRNVRCCRIKKSCGKNSSLS